MKLPKIIAMDLDVYANTIRNLIIQENDLENKKINWLIIFNGILLSGYVQLRDDILLSILLAFVGIIISLSFWWSLFLGNKAVDFLIKKWQDKLKYHDRNFDEFPPVAGIPYYSSNNPNYKLQEKITSLGKFIAPSKIISPVLISIWITLLVCTLCKCLR